MHHNHYLFTVLPLLLCFAVFLFLSDETIVDRLGKLQVTTSERVAPPVVANDITTNVTNRWIHVLEFGEGMSAWMLSLTEVLLAARTLNATLVEPCVQDGRLVSCGQVAPQENATRLHHLFNMTLLKELHPYIASYQDFERQTVGARTFPACMQKRTKKSWGSKVCGNLTTCHSDEQCKQLEDAILAYGPSVLEIQWYFRGGLNNTRVETHKLIPPPDRVMQLKTQYMQFNNEHHDYVDGLLKTAGINEDSFSVVHWRAELRGMDYVACAQDIVNSRKLMDPKKSSQFILMSSLNTKEEYMWSGARKKAGQQSSNAPKALQFLLDNGFAKLDTLVAEDVSDPSILAVYDLILAMKAQDFATCARAGRCESTVCAKCNHQGKFANLAIELRDTFNKTSLACWPE